MHSNSRRRARGEPAGTATRQRSRPMVPLVRIRGGWIRHSLALLRRAAPHAWCQSRGREAGMGQDQRSRRARDCGVGCAWSTLPDAGAAGRTAKRRGCGEGNLPALEAAKGEANGAAIVAEAVTLHVPSRVSRTDSALAVVWPYSYAPDGVTQGPDVSEEEVAPSSTPGEAAGKPARFRPGKRRRAPMRPGEALPARVPRSGERARR